MVMNQLISIQNGRKQVPIFTPAAMENRLAELRVQMAAENIDAVIFTSIHNINYYNHFVYCSFGRPYGLVVTQDKLKSITANIDGGQPWRRGFGENVIFTDWEKDNYFRAIQQEITNSGRVGIEYDHINLENLKNFRTLCLMQNLWTFQK